MSTLAVVEAVLRNAAVPLSVREIVERAGDTLPTKSKTPDTVVARDLSMDIKKKGDGSPPGECLAAPLHLCRKHCRVGHDSTKTATKFTTKIWQAVL